MAEFTAEVFQNEYLPGGGGDVHAIVAVACSAAGTVANVGASAAGTGAAEIIIIDTSGSMGPDGPGGKIAAARKAAHVAIDEIVDGTWFAVISGTATAHLAFPDARRESAMVKADAATRQWPPDARPPTPIPGSALRRIRVGVLTSWRASTAKNSLPCLRDTDRLIGQTSAVR